jgi:hypothetical protein
LNFIKKQLGVGSIYIDKKRSMAYFKIRNLKNIESVIFPIFDKYSLLTSKQFNYLKFKQAFEITKQNYIYLVSQQVSAKQQTLENQDICSPSAAPTPLKIDLIKELWNSKCPDDYISPA